MKVGFNGHLLHDLNGRGWNRYTINLICNLHQFGVAPIVYCLQPPNEHYRLRLEQSHCEIRLAPKMRYLQFEQMWLPRQARFDKLDVLHSPFNFGLPYFCSCPTVLTLHDAIEAAFNRKKMILSKKFSPAVMLNQFQQSLSRSVATRVITVSEHAKKDLQQYYRIPASRISVVYEAADDNFQLQGEAGKHVASETLDSQANPYLFYVGGCEDRKNVPFLIECFARAELGDHELVLAGGDVRKSADIAKAIEQFGISAKVRLLGWVEDSELVQLYRNATAFVYPSFYEGFGLQLCEAMACGCPVLSSNRTSLPEILGDGGAVFSPEDPGSLIEDLRRVVFDPQYRERLRAHSIRRGSAFTWTKCAEETVSIYRGLINE